MPRPSLQQVLRRVDEQVQLFHLDYGYLPRAIEVDEILRDIWIEDTFHSTSLEGNALSKCQVAKLLQEGEASGPLKDSLEVQGYARAAQWVYHSAFDYPPDRGVPPEVISRIHYTLAAHELHADPTRLPAGRPPSD